MDKASKRAIEEVCERCPLYSQNCGMLEYPSQCVNSGHFIDGYRCAEKDLALTCEDIKEIMKIVHDVERESQNGLNYMSVDIEAEEVLRRFNEKKKG